MALERIRRLPVIQEIDTPEGPVEQYVGVDQAQEYVSNAVAGMEVVGGSLIVVPDRRQVGYVGDEPEFATYGFVVKWESTSPVARQRKPEPEPEPEVEAEPEPALEPVGAETSE